MLALDFTSAVSLEEQLRRQLREAIASGRLKPGDPLPTVRQLADDLDIHFNTAARAYRRLRDEGLLAVARGRGVRVCRTEERPRPASPAEPGLEAARAHIREAIVEARLAGLRLPGVKELMHQELQAWIERELGT